MPRGQLNAYFDDFNLFREYWQISESIFTDFLTYLDKDSISYNFDSLLVDRSFLNNRLKSEIAGSIWGKDEAVGIRLVIDNQIVEALNYFNEADALLGSGH